MWQEREREEVMCTEFGALEGTERVRPGSEEKYGALQGMWRKTGGARVQGGTYMTSTEKLTLPYYSQIVQKTTFSDLQNCLIWSWGQRQQLPAVFTLTPLRVPVWCHSARDHVCVSLRGVSRQPAVVMCCQDGNKDFHS